MTDTRHRPTAVVGAVVILYFMGVLGVIGAITPMVDAYAARDGWGFVGSLVDLASAVLLVVLANKVLGGSNVARVAVVVLLSLGALLSALSLAATSILLAVVPVLPALVVVGLLTWSRGARGYFARPATSPSTSPPTSPSTSTSATKDA